MNLNHIFPEHFGPYYQQRPHVLHRSVRVESTDDQYNYQYDSNLPRFALYDYRAPKNRRLRERIRQVQLAKGTKSLQMQQFNLVGCVFRSILIRIPDL